MLRVDPLIGRTIAGNYLITERLATGSMGRLYRAEQTALGRAVAIKVIHPRFAGDETAATRFITEAHAASLLHHPNAVAVFDFGATPDRLFYLLTELLTGQTLARLT